MSKHRFYIAGQLEMGATITLDQEESRHAFKVLRLAVHDEILLVNGKKLQALARIEAIGKTQLIARVLSVSELSLKRPSELILLQGLLKGPKMDWLVEKITEIGVACFQPVICEFSVARENKLERWRRIAESALKQSGNLLMPDIMEPTPLEQAVEKYASSALKIILQPGASLSLFQCLQKCRDTQGPLTQVLVVIGPEGGFSPKEEQFLLSRGFLPACLSHNILRGESAAILTTGICRHFLDFF